MVTEHTAVNQELMSLAASKSVTLPADVNAKQKSTNDMLSGMTADSFDREYIKIQVKDHEAMVKLFDKQSKNMTDADTQAFAAKHLPALQGHLSTNTRTMNGSNGMSSGNNSNSRMQGNTDMNMNGGQNSNANRNMSNGNVRSNSNSDLIMDSNMNMNMNMNSNRNSNANRNPNPNGNRNTNSNSRRNMNSNSNVNNF